MKPLQRYRLRMQRRRLLWKGFRSRHQLEAVANRTSRIDGDILAFTTLRNEYPRLPYFLSYYRDMGVGHFLMVDNGSTDGSLEYLRDQEDVSLWTTGHSYRKARFGMDWLTWLLMRYGHGRWCLTVDPDEFLVYPFCDSRPLRALTDWMDASSIRVFPAMLLDMYPKGPLGRTPYEAGTDPFESACWFDSGNYTIQRNAKYGNLWIQGGVRSRAFFPDDPEQAPALNKLPLVKWSRRYVYCDSTHMLLPRGLNQVYEINGGEKISGCLLHAKFVGSFADKAGEEAERGEHYMRGREYKAYADAVNEGKSDLWHEHSERYINWRQLEILGLMSKGSWA